MLNMPANLENSAVATGLKMVSFHASPKEEKCQECSNCFTIALISHASKIMLKILQARLQQYMTENFQMYKLWNILKEIGHTRPPYLSPEKPVCRSRSNSKKLTWQFDLWVLCLF